MTHEPTADEIERVKTAILAAYRSHNPSEHNWDAVTRAAILAMDRRSSPEGDWRVKDYADGWCWYRTEKEARESDEAINGALVEFVPRASPPAANIYESAAVALELAASNWDELGEKRRGSHGRHLLDFAKAAGLREAAQVLRSIASPPAPAAPEHNDGYKRAFAAQSRKLQAVLDIPGVKETLAQLNWLEWDEGAPAVAVPEGQFLLDRLNEIEINDDLPKAFIRDWWGHVEPAIARFRMALAAAPVQPIPRSFLRDNAKLSEGS